MEVDHYARTMEIPLKDIKKEMRKAEKESLKDLRRRRKARARAELRAFIADYPHVVTGLGTFLGMLGLYAGTRNLNIVLGAPFIGAVAGSLVKTASEDPIITTQKRYLRRKKNNS